MPVIRISLLVTILSCLYVPAANAREYEIPEDSVTMKYVAKEIVIESFKQSSDLRQLPMSSTLLSDKLLKEYNVVGLKDVVGLVPNLFIPDYGSKMTSPAYIRGIGSRINSPSVGLYVDGVPYFDRSTFDVNIDNIDRIEVLRGPQGTLYGRNTMGGIINIFTPSPFRDQGTNVNLSAGSHHSYRTGISHYGKVDDKVGYSVSGNYGHSGGYFNNVFTGAKADPIDEVSTRARLSWRLHPQLTMNLILAYEYSDQDGYPYRVYDKNTSSVGDIDYNERSYFRRNMSTNGLNLDYVTDHFRLGSQTSFQYFDGMQGLDQDFTSVDKYYADFVQRQQMYTQEFNIKSLHENQLYTWQFGAFGFYQNYSQANDVDYRTLGKHAIQDVHNPTKGLAAYHQSSFNNVFTQGLSFVLGLRYDFEKTKSQLLRTSITGTNAPVASPEEYDRTHFAQLTPKASVQYSFGNSGLTYFSVTKGYKTGGFNTTAEVKEERVFDPEHSWCYEIGGRRSFLGEKLTLDLTLFYIDWKDQQISQPKTSVTQGGQGYVLFNAGRSSSKGVEFAVGAKPVSNVGLQFSYGYTDARYEDYRKGEIVYDNNSLPMVPRHTLSLTADYSVNVGTDWLDTIILNGRYNGVGKLYWNDENDIAQPYYGLFNAGVSFVKKQASVSFWTKNIGNKDYLAYYFSTGSGAATQYYVQKGKPFTCGVNLSLKF